ncbi:MAG: cystathionine gamma-lyase [Burkholderiales bacterium]|nr:MAG: cystathionine gamma-lyase [Burkholderiales bacterium]
MHAGRPAPVQGAPFMPGPVFAAPYHAKGDPAAAAHTYARFDNPTWQSFESALAELEGGPSAVFASGMAAVTAVFGSWLRPGDRVLIPADCYYTVRSVAREYWSQMGIEPVIVAGDGTRFVGAIRSSPARLVWLETPSNPALQVYDIAAIASAAHDGGALLAVDNTTPTALGQSPLALGADYSVAADTKALAGHSDLLLGHVSARNESLIEPVRAWRTRMGAVPGPFEVWLAHRSLATLALRLDRQCANALSIAQRLSRHPAVASVRYPGLPDDPSHALAAAQMRAFGPIVGFVLTDQASAERFLSRLRLIFEATSFGGVHSTAERRARWGGDAVEPGFIRLSAGIEHARDLVADIEQALAD